MWEVQEKEGGIYLITGRVVNEAKIFRIAYLHGAVM